VAKQLPGRPGAQLAAVIDPLPAGQRRVDERHRLVAGVGPPGRIGKIDMLVDQLAQSQPDRQGGRQQPGVGDQALVVKGDVDLVGL
jgi:hypothetical protein